MRTKSSTRFRDKYYSLTRIALCIIVRAQVTKLFSLQNSGSYQDQGHYRKISEFLLTGHICLKLLRNILRQKICKKQGLNALIFNLVFFRLMFQPTILTICCGYHEQAYPIKPRPRQRLATIYTLIIPWHIQSDVLAYVGETAR